MILVETQLRVADNSGATRVRCIGMITASGSRVAKVGDAILVSVRSCNSGGKAKKGSVYGAIVVRTVSSVRRKDGMNIRFDDNAVVLVDRKTLEPAGTRVLGPIAREVRSISGKIVSLADEVL
ncbi:MAG: 50S ribosomal protein L14 [Alphaproteobacteria bacterium]|nr:50S ribosomal protein L14 [Rickettsiales bacterium]